jgi:cell wall-associated NlpC family hydrolase
MRTSPSRRACLRAFTLGAGASAVLVAGSLPADAQPQRTSRSVQVDLAAAQRSLAALSGRISQAVEAYDQAQIALAAARRRAAAAAARADAAGREYAAKRRLLSAYAVSAYQTGGMPGLSAAVVSGTPADYLDRISLLGQVAHNQAELVRVVNAARGRYAAAAARATTAQSAAATVFRSISKTRASIERDIGSQRVMLASLRGELNRLERAAAAAAAARRPKATKVIRATVERVRRSPGSGGTARSRHAAPPPSSGRAGIAVRAAYSVLGRPYRYGSAGPGSFDCSGLTMWAWAHAGVHLPHSSAAQYGSGRHVSRSQLQPGDLLFFYSPIHHVGIYVGGSRMIDAPHTGTVVSVRSVLWSNYVGALRPG